MAGTNDLQNQQPQEVDCYFEWDENSQLYYHSSTGFYYNPHEGWYYSSRDGLYFKFENGNYVHLDSNLDEGDKCDMHDNFGRMASENFVEDKQPTSVDSLEDDEFVAERAGTVTDEPITVERECIKTHLTEDPPPPSEWLEDTLIDLFLSGYPNQAVSSAPHTVGPTGTDVIDNLDASADGDKDIDELEEGEWIPEDHQGSSDSSGNLVDEGASWEEENWRAQYGQVTEPNEESISGSQVIDLWDWEMVRRTTKNGKNHVAKLLGRLVKCSSQLHPSVSPGGSRLKTAPIHEAHLDLVRVRSGQIYRLRRPSRQYLASLSAYDSSDPTRDWGFPQLSVNRKIQPLQRFDGHGVYKEASMPSENLRASKKENSLAYRDRAAERRALHGGFGVGPGQKKSSNNIDSTPSSPTSACPEEAAEESFNISFGAGSYARRLMENMGWKEGEGLGRSTKGLVEPLQAIGNKGNAGLGWDECKRKHSLSNG